MLFTTAVFVFLARTAVAVIVAPYLDGFYRGFCFHFAPEVSCCPYQQIRHVKKNATYNKYDSIPSSLWSADTNGYPKNN
jgi:hypothetical protein